jgi:hypothetical protein
MRLDHAIRAYHTLNPSAIRELPTFERDAVVHWVERVRTTSHE